MEVEDSNEVMTDAGEFGGSRCGCTYRQPAKKLARISDTISVSSDSASSMASEVFPLAVGPVTITSVFNYLTGEFYFSATRRAISTITCVAFSIEGMGTNS